MDTGTPLVTVCIVHYERPELVRVAVDSVFAQDYPAVEAVLIDDGSQSAEAHAALDAIEPDFLRRGWRVLRQGNRYLGAARNAAAAAARGEWLLFLDDDNVLFADAVSRLVRAARFSGADCITAASIRFSGEGDPRFDAESRRAPIRFVGPAFTSNLFRNMIGDACALVRRDAFEAVGGFEEERGFALSDLSFFNCMIQAGYRVEYMPQTTFYYRVQPEGMLKSSNRSSAMHRHFVTLPYLKGLSAEERALASFAIGCIDQSRVPRQLAESAMRRRDRKAARGSRADMGRSWRFRAALIRLRETLMAHIVPARWAGRVVGAVENRDLLQVRGWLLDPVEPERKRSVAIHVEGRLREVVAAESRRDDIARWRGTDGYHGFLWEIPEDVAATDGARIDVLDAVTRQTLRGSPVRIEGGRVVASGRRRR